MTTRNALRTAVLIPCWNEEATIGKVVDDFRRILPDALVYVYDNNSGDRTREVAREAGALVRSEPLQGKGHVMRRMFADVEADIYVLVDGDDTYDPSSAPKMIAHLLDRQLDMVNGARVTENNRAYRTGHRLGNKLFTNIVRWIFGNRFKDMLSGYRVFSRRFVKSFPALSSGFEIETELTVHALELKMPIDEMTTPYKGRPDGSTSKLSTFKDGFKILWSIVVLIKEEHPMLFFSILAALLFSASVFLAWPLMIDYWQTGLVPRLPTAVIAITLGAIGFLSLACGLILETVTRGRWEMKRMRYLNIPAVTR